MHIPPKRNIPRLRKKHPLIVLIYLNIFLQYALGTVYKTLSIGTLITTILIYCLTGKGGGALASNGAAGQAEIN